MPKVFNEHYQDGQKTVLFSSKTTITAAEQQEALRLTAYYYAKAVLHFCLRMNIIDRHSVMTQMQDAVAFLMAIHVPQQDAKSHKLIDNALHQWTLFQQVIGYDARTEATLFTEKMARLVEGAQFAHAHLHSTTSTDTAKAATSSLATTATNNTIKTVTATTPQLVANSTITGEAVNTNPTITISLTAATPPSFGTDQSPVITEMANELNLKKRSINQEPPREQPTFDVNPKRPTAFFDPTSILPKKSLLQTLRPPVKKTANPIKSHQPVINPHADAIICSDKVLMTGWNENNL